MKVSLRLYEGYSLSLHNVILILCKHQVYQPSLRISAEHELTQSTPKRQAAVTPYKEELYKVSAAANKTRELQSLMYIHISSKIMNSGSLRAGNCIALARRRLLTGSSLCTSEKTRLLRRYWAEVQVTARAGADYAGQRGQRMMSTTSTLHAKKAGKGSHKPSEYKYVCLIC